VAEAHNFSWGLSTSTIRMRNGSLLLRIHGRGFDMDSLPAVPGQLLDPLDLEGITARPAHVGHGVRGSVILARPVHCSRAL
jgi:hypothetical protein